MPRSTERYHHGSLAQALRLEALAQVEARGAHALSARAVARAVGVDAAAAYRHYKDKRALLAAVSAEGFGVLGAAMAARPVAEESWLSSQARAYVGFALGRKNLYRLMFGGFVEVTEVRAHVKAEALSAYALLGLALDELWTERGWSGEHRRGAEFQAWSALHGAVSLRLDGRAAPVVPDPELGEYIVGMLIAAWGRP